MEPRDWDFWRVLTILVLLLVTIVCVWLVTGCGNLAPTAFSGATTADPTDWHDPSGHVVPWARSYPNGTFDLWANLSGIARKPSTNDYCVPTVSAVFAGTASGEPGPVTASLVTSSADRATTVKDGAFSGTLNASLDTLTGTAWVAIEDSCGAETLSAPVLLAR